MDIVEPGITTLARRAGNQIAAWLPVKMTDQMRTNICFAFSKHVTL